MRRTKRTVAVLAATTAFLTVGAVAWAATDLTANGGARRLGGDQTQAVKSQVKSGPARNVILFIGDGMGDSEITIARNYQYGAAGRLPGIDALPLTGEYTTYALTKSTDPNLNGKPDYVTDSAASGSGWSTGTKTYNGAISVDLAGHPQKTILEIAKANGLRTGDVSTAEIQDATPAVLVSHVTDRSCYGPSVTTTKCPTNALENGGLGSITEQLLNTRPDVTLGGGAATFSETAKAGPWSGQTLLAQAQARGYRVVTDKTALAAVTKADQASPVLGLFASGNFDVRWAGPSATPTGGTAAPQSCTANPAYDATKLPTLADMTAKAISLLDDKHAKKGFLLQVEGASIDKQDHAANACGQIGETVDLDEAVQAALAFAKKDGNTLVLVTADHGHTSQIIYPNTLSAGVTVNLLTHDQAPMTISYATAPYTTKPDGTVTVPSQDHTGTEVRLAAYGPGAANVVGLTDQTDLFFTMKSVLKLDQKAPFPADPRSWKGWPGSWYGWGWYGWKH